MKKKIKQFINFILYKLRIKKRKKYYNVYVKKSNSDNPFIHIGKCYDFKITHKINKIFQTKKKDLQIRI